ncbi:MAG: ATP-binding protein [Anaerolineae bacterium]|nr:ATP-binding protein [Anaerolineae bacterium]
MLIAMAGLPGTGKSTLARALAERLPAVVLDKDRVRAALFPPDKIEYATAQDDFCVNVMLETASYLLERDPTTMIILDGRTFSRRYQVEAVLQAAYSMQTQVYFIECICADEIAVARLAHDHTGGHHPAANRDAALYMTVKTHREPLEIPRLIVDTGKTLTECVDDCLRYLDFSGS